MKHTYFLFSLLTTVAFAQNDTVRLNTITVSATRFVQPSRLSPYQIETVSRERIAFLNQQNTADLLQQTGNVFVQKSQGGGGSPVLRGFEASRVLLVVDGIRINNAIFRAGHLQNVLRIDPAMLERAEVLFGSGSTLYGSDALGGVMYFQTRNPELSAGGITFRPNAYVRAASATGERTAHVDLSIGTRRLGFLTGITAASYGDVLQGANRSDAYPNFGKLTQYVDNSSVIDQIVQNPDLNRQVGTAYHQLDLLQKVLFQPSEGVRHTLNFQYSITGNVPRYDRSSEVTAGKPSYADWYYGPEKRLLAAYQLAVTRPTAAYDQLQVSVGYQAIEESRNSRRLGGATLKRQLEAVGVWSLNADAQKQFGPHAFQYGLELTHNDVTSTATRLNVKTQAVTPADTRYPDGGSTLQTAALYVNDRLTVSPILNLQAGLRYTLTSLKATFGDKTFFPFPFNDVTLSPSGLAGNIGAILTPSVSTKISLLGSTGFRAPNVDDLTKVFESSPGTLIVPNPNIRPEYTYTAELSVSQWIGDVLRLDATAYHTWFENAIVVDVFTFNGASTILYDGKTSTVLAPQNKRRATVQGFNVGATLNLGNALTFSGSVNGTSGHIVDDKNTPLDHIPPTYGRASLSYRRAGVHLEAFTLFSGWKRLADYNPDGEDNGTYATPDGMPGWATANLRGSVRIGRVASIQAACENLFDTNYRTFASGFSAPGRNFMLTLRVGK